MKYLHKVVNGFGDICLKLVFDGGGTQDLEVLFELFSDSFNFLLAAVQGSLGFVIPFGEFEVGLIGQGNVRNQQRAQSLAGEVGNGGVQQLELIPIRVLGLAFQDDIVSTFTEELDLALKKKKKKKK